MQMLNFAGSEAENVLHLLFGWMRQFPFLFNKHQHAMSAVGSVKMNSWEMEKLTLLFRFNGAWTKFRLRSVPKPNTAVRADPNTWWLPYLNLISDEIVVIQVLICVCAVRKFQVHREPDPSSQFLGSVLKRCSGYWAPAQTSAFSCCWRLSNPVPY